MSSLVSSLNIIELNEDTLLAMVKNVETHAVVLWRDQGLSSPDAKLNAFLDAAKQFEVQKLICVFSSHNLVRTRTKLNGVTWTRTALG